LKKVAIKSAKKALILIFIFRL